LFKKNGNRSFFFLFGHCGCLSQAEAMTSEIAGESFVSQESFEAKFINAEKE
jgi:hypothetical protein